MEGHIAYKNISTYVKMPKSYQKTTVLSFTIFSQKATL